VNRRGEAAERFAERRRQEDEAPRLRDVIPDLLTCRVDISEARADATIADTAHTRYIVVARAPPLLIIPCSDPSCRDGGHDVSSVLLRGLRERRNEIPSEDRCNGNVGAEHCGRMLRFHAQATYAEPPT
jgi:hypothetical protein